MRVSPSYKRIDRLYSFPDKLPGEFDAEGQFRTFEQKHAAAFA